MSDPERGPYTPPSDRLAFDPRQPVRGGGPAPVTLIVSALVLAAIVGGVFLVYRHGVRHKGEGPAVVGAPVNDIRTPAPVDATNAPPPSLVIEKTDALANATPAFAPPPEQPLPRPVTAAPPPTIVAQPVSPPKPAPSKPAPAVVAEQTPAAAPPAATPPAAKPAAPLSIGSLADAALGHKSPPPKSVPAAAAAAPPTAAMVSAPVAGWVQIGAFSSSALADKGWHDTAKFAPAFMSDKGLKVQPVSVNGKTLYRAFVTGFRSHDAAEAFCIKLKAASKPCIVK